MASTPTPTLDTLPTELRRIIVSYLAPGVEGLSLGCKRDLKNANLAHSCLREWVTEYMFHDMVLEHVSLVQTSHLQRFSKNKNTARLLKNVKSIQVKIQPALCWETLGHDESARMHPRRATTRRLLKKFGVEDLKLEKVSESQREYIGLYYRELVEPFMDEDRWSQLRLSALESWQYIFSQFPNLQEIAVGCCGRHEYPTKTWTNEFVKQYGDLYELDPPFEEDTTVNMGWASIIVLQSAPLTVRKLHLTMVNIDWVSPHANMANNLLNISIQHSLNASLDTLFYITSLSVTVRGTPGVHGAGVEYGKKNWNSAIGSAPALYYWRKVLKAMKNLRHLEFHEDYEKQLTFTEGRSTDKIASIIPDILAGISFEKLQTLRLCGVLIDEFRDFDDIFWKISSNIKCVILEDIRLIHVTENWPQTHSWQGPEFDHMDGAGWLGICEFISRQYSKADIWITNPLSNINNVGNFSLAFGYNKKIRRIPRVHLYDSGPYKVPSPPLCWR